MKTWTCTVCGWVYDEAKGDPDYDLAPGVPFADLPEDFVCPLCGVGKDMFEEQAQPLRMLINGVNDFIKICVNQIDYSCKFWYNQRR